MYLLNFRCLPFSCAYCVLMSYCVDVCGVVERLLVFLDGVTGSEGSDMIGYGAKDPHEQHNSVLTQWSKNIHCECEEVRYVSVNIVCC